MRSRLFIFSFKALAVFPSLTKAAGIACAGCAAGFLFMQVFYGGLIKSMKSDPIVQRIHLLDTAEEPALLFLGSSRLHSSLDKEAYSRALGLEAGQIVNLSGDSFEPWDHLAWLRNSEGKASPGAVAVVEVNPWTFNKTPWHPVLHEPMRYTVEFRIWANVWERIHCPYPFPEDRRLMILGCFRPIALRSPLVEWFSRIDGVRHEWIGEIPSPVYHRNRELEKSQAEDENFKAENISRWHLRDYCFSDYRKQVFENLLSLLHQKGYRVVLIHFPVRKEYYDYIRQRPDLLTEYSRHEAYLESLAKRYSCFFWKTPDEMGLTFSALVDYGHFTREGCVLTSERIADGLKNLFPANAEDPGVADGGQGMRTEQTAMMRGKEYVGD